jgi:hypothetical protein
MRRLKRRCHRSDAMGMNDHDAVTGGVPLPPPPPSQGLADRPSITSPAPASGGATGSTTGGFLVLAGGALVVAGVFLPWLQASSSLTGVRITENGLSIGTFGTLILGGFAVVRGIAMIRPNQPRLGSPIVGGALILILMLLRWSSLQDALTAARALDPRIQASIGIGVWAVIGGACLVIAGSIVAPRRQLRRAISRARSTQR